MDGLGRERGKTAELRSRESSAAVAAEEVKEGSLGIPEVGPKKVWGWKPGGSELLSNEYKGNNSHCAWEVGTWN